MMSTIKRIENLENTVNEMNGKLNAIYALLSNKSKPQDAQSAPLKEEEMPELAIVFSKEHTDGKVEWKDRPTVYLAMGCRVKKNGAPYKGDFEKHGGYTVYRATAIQLGKWVPKRQ